MLGLVTARSISQLAVSLTYLRLNLKRPTTLHHLPVP